MNQGFTLIPFSPDAQAGIVITGAIGRHSNTLSVSYLLTGLLSDIVIRDPADVPERRDHLWEETCMEFFISPENSGNYWEFNLSPAGHWNVYNFKSYRRGMREEPAFTSLPFVVQMKSDAFKISVELALDDIVASNRSLAVGISAVIREPNGGKTYWALSHSGPEPDFHRRDSFIIEL